MISAFIELRESEQCEELRDYFRTLGANIGAENSPEGLHKDLDEILNVCDCCFRCEKEADTECLLNSIVSLLIQVPQTNPVCYELIKTFCKKLVAINQLHSVSLRVLQNLFEGIGPNEKLRYDIYLSLVMIAGQSNQIKLVYVSMEILKKWLNTKTVGIEKFQHLLRTLHEVLIKDMQSQQASKVMIELLSTYTSENASQARHDAHRCIVSSISDPKMFLMDHLLSLKPVKFLEGEPIHDLLTIFISEKLPAYTHFYNANKEFVDGLGLSHERNLHKMRLLTFMQIAETRKEISFNDISVELNLDQDSNQVESFIIDVLKTRLVKAKIDQVNKKVSVTSTVHRTFGKPQWQQLRDSLRRWKRNLGAIETAITNAVESNFEQGNQLQMGKVVA